MIAVHQWITKLTLKTLMDDSWRGSLAWPHPPQSFTNTQSKLFKLSRLHTEWWHAHMQTLSQTSPPRRGSQESYSEIFESGIFFFLPDQPWWQFAEQSQHPPDRRSHRWTGCPGCTECSSAWSRAALCGRWGGWSTAPWLLLSDPYLQDNSQLCGTKDQKRHCWQHFNITW